MVRAFDDRHAVELSGGERGAHRQRKHEAVEVRHHRGRGLMSEDCRDGQTSEARDGLIDAARARREGCASCLGRRERGLHERVGAALDDRFVEEAGRQRRSHCECTLRPPAD